jgi:hypothetical protein
MPPTRRSKPISIAEGRRFYEQTNVPVDHIAAMMGMGHTALYRRIHAWRWRMRRPTIPLSDPPRQADEVFGETTLAERASLDVAATAARVLRAVQYELDAVTTILRQLAPQASEERERAQRMLASLTRTLQELTRLNLPGATPTEQDVNDRGPADPDEFARELLRRLELFAARATPGLPDESGAGTA